MIEALICIAGILYLSLLIEDRLKVPLPLSLITLSFLLHHVAPDALLLTGDTGRFAALVLFLLPVLLISDSLELSIEDLKAHGLSLFYLAVVAVALSVVVAIFTANQIFGEYHLSVAAIIALFAMVLATDPVSVVSIFSKFELPHRLKILAEGESLFNDATALIVFVFIGLYALEGGQVTVAYVGQVSAVVVFGSVALGLVIGVLGLVAMKTTENRIAELLVLLLTGYAAFVLAEHFYAVLNLMGGHSHMHLSGILACIVATITVHHVMTRSLGMDERVLQAEADELEQEAMQVPPSRRLIRRAIGRIESTVEERDRHRRTKEDIQLLAIVANTVLFIAMAEIIDLKLLLQYKAEILAMFVLTTLIRALMMAKFAMITTTTRRMTRINFRWWGILTFAGIKGGLSVVMVMLMPADFPHLEMFKAIVVGVVVLSTFIYSAILLALIAANREAFRREVEAEHP
ncbi:MAG TPA: cation:proton antiporter [Mariprofundaceae bacterium]|nr:cation:proton antiporter [Mariprofundaceae bacterium]